MTSLEILLRSQSKHGFQEDSEEEEGNLVRGPSISSSDDEGDLDNDSKHSKLLEAISSMDGKKKSKVKQRSEPSAEVSDFQLNTKDAQGKGVWIHDLMGALRNTPSHSALKKQMNTINKRKLLPAPLHQHETEKIQRQMAYQAASKEVSKWDHVVHTNRRAENLTFPLNQQVLGLPTTDQFVKKFKPSTPLEQEVYKILNGSKFAERPNKKLTQAEEEAIKAMSLSEARERRSELQKHRALVSFYEAKCRRQKKIKSKKYHRIQRKSKARLESKKVEELMMNDPEAAQETLEKMDKTRATERMSLKHRNTGKWAKNMMRYGRHNISARQELAEQLQKSHELTEKIAEAVGDNNKEDALDESGGEEEEEALGAGGIKPSLRDINNPWFSGGKAGEEKDGEEEEAREGEQERFVALEAVQATRDDGVDDAGDGEDDGDENDEELERDHKMLKMRQQERRSGAGGGGGDVSGNKDDSDDDEDGTEAGDSPKVSKGKRSAKDKRTAAKKIKKSQKKKRVIQAAEDNEDGDRSNREDDLLDEGLERRQTHSSLEDQEWLNRPQEEKRALERPPTRKGALASSSSSSSSSSANVDPGKVFTMKVKDIKSLEPELVERNDEGVDDEDDDDDDDNRETERRERRMNIQQAFADDDVVEEFREEKAVKVERDKPKDIDLTLPGWGDWGGVGVQPSKKKRKRFVIKAPPQAPRKDARLPNVIISENRDKHIAMHQVNSLPFPFSSTEQFERSIRAPVGPTWNTPAAVQALTRPKLTTKIGAIIAPIQAEETFKGKGKGRKRPPPQKHKDQQRKGPRPDISLDGGDDQRGRHGKKRRRTVKGK